ncbi:GntR family transcriptional regulator [Pseudonocardia kunmingensis]|uniref:DNA-binding GntR family transcriptional regulator n=1 Tax=Pseudonocardia kunmingensis TaxID=630975 RepID=A0A543CXK6_9PSEU|nr:GntR family transcriptional regulator [Pseudonocardia kunmingensis]TQM01779.1 DNA-binding GntR family transcriptional regulator [Pseudonocardia kunmingensis]
MSKSPGTGSVVDRIADELRRRIRRGELVGGQRLIEAEWTQELGVSRGPVREALGRLASEGLVVIEAKRGAVVRRLLAKDIDDLYEARAAIEGQAAAAAARRIDEGGHRAALEELMAEHDDFVGGGEFGPYLGVSVRFHELVLEIADNEILSRLGGQLHVLAYHLQATRVSRATGPVPHLSVSGSAECHREIGSAILRGDAYAAERLMREHQMATRDGILAVDRDSAAELGRR